MEVVPFVVTYNGMATGPAIKRCVEHLMADAPAFGAAVERMELYPHCHTREPLVAGLGAIAARFQDRLATLPFVRFRRTRRLFEVAYASSFVHRDDLFGAAKIELPSVEFCGLCQEFAAAMLQVRRRLKSSDEFDASGLEAHLQHRLALLKLLP